MPSFRRTVHTATAAVVAAGVFGASPVAAAPTAVRPSPTSAAQVATATIEHRVTAARTSTATSTTPAGATPNVGATRLGEHTAAETPTAETPVAPLANPTVVLYGDSLAWEARGAFALALADRAGVQVHERTFGGTAICDWMTAMADDAATLRPGAVVVEFSGNNFTRCMHDDAGHPLTGDALVERYAADAETVVATFASHGTQVIFAGAPVAREADGDSIISRLNESYARLAHRHDGVRYVDAGASVLADGSWTATLPCLRWEPCGADGTNVVRAPDGLHFCPSSDDAERGVTGDCPVWSSGAVRFGAALAAPVIEHLDEPTASR